MHVHALAFFAWLALFTAQIVLVRRRQVAVHRRLGVAGAWLAPVMVVLGVMTAIVSERAKFGTPLADTRFLSVMFADMIAFGGLVGAGMWLGEQRRICWEIQTLAEGAWPFVRFQLLPAYVWIAAVGVFDLAAWKRLNPAYLGGVAWCLALHLLAGWLYFQPFWQQAAVRTIGR